MIDKKLIKKKMLSLLEEEVLKSQKIAKDSNLMATGNDMKAEGKYDTRAIEASYLAGAQERRVNQVKQDLQLVKNLRTTDFLEFETICLGSLVRLQYEKVTSLYYISPCAMGPLILEGGQKILVVSAYSPIGKNAIGLEKGDEFEVKTEKYFREYKVIEVI